MKKLRIYLCLLLAAALIAAGLPVMAEDGVTRAFAVHCFVTAVGEGSLPAGPGGLSAFADSADVPEEYRRDMELAAANGIILGSGGRLLPNEELTRLEAMLILGRCLPGLDEVRPAAEFVDVPDWAAAEIERLYMAGIVNGYGGGQLGSYDRVSAEQLGLLTDRLRTAFPDNVSIKDDFYAAVNRGYLTSAQVNRERPMISAVLDREDEISSYLVRRSEELLAKYESGEGLREVEAMAARFYKMAKGEQPQDNIGAVLAKYINMIDASTGVRSLGTAAGNIYSELSVPVLFELNVPCRLYMNYPVPVNGVYIDALDSGIDRSYWADNPEGVRAAYEAYAAELLSLAGISAPAGVLAEISAFQRDVSLAGMSMAEYYAYDPEETGEQYVFDWKELSGMYAGELSNPVTTMLFALDGREMTGRYDYIVSDRKKMDKAVELMNSMDLESLKTMAKLNLIIQLSEFMPASVLRAEEKFTADVLGFGFAPLGVEESAAELTASIFSPAYEEDFVKNHTVYDAEYLKTMTEDITAAFKKILSSSTSLSPQAVQNVSEKLDSIEADICGYNDGRGSDGEKLSYQYPLDDGGSLLENGINFLRAVSGGWLSAVTLVDTDMPSYVVNACYGVYTNKIQVMAGYLYAPIYDPEASYEENLAGIGDAIAHELSHAFDSTGSNYRADGSYIPLFSTADRERYDAATEKVAAYFGGYKNRWGDAVDGALTLDENIADILAMECVIEVAKEKNLDMDKLFRAYAESWASACTPEYARYLIRCDMHSPNSVRVNAILSNFEEFYVTYGITEGDGMYVPPEDRVKIF